MLTDSEMQALLDAHEHQDEAAPPATLELTVRQLEYLLALDAALPKLVEEIRKLRKAMADRPFAKPPRESYHQDKGAFND